MDKTTFTNLFAPFDRDATPRYRELRRLARERFASLPLPTARAEDWRFTNIAPIVETSFALPDKVHARVALEPNDTRILFLNGRFAKQSAESTADVQVGFLA